MFLTRSELAKLQRSIKIAMQRYDAAKEAQLHQDTERLWAALSSCLQALLAAFDIIDKARKEIDEAIREADHGLDAQETRKLMEPDFEN